MERKTCYRDAKYPCMDAGKWCADARLQDAERKFFHFERWNRFRERKTHCAAWRSRCTGRLARCPTFRPRVLAFGTCAVDVVFQSIAFENQVLAFVHRSIASAHHCIAFGTKVVAYGNRVCAFGAQVRAFGARVRAFAQSTGAFGHCAGESANRVRVFAMRFRKARQVIVAFGIQIQALGVALLRAEGPPYFVPGRTSAKIFPANASAAQACPRALGWKGSTSIGSGEASRQA